MSLLIHNIVPALVLLLCVLSGTGCVELNETTRHDETTTATSSAAPVASATSEEMSQKIQDTSALGDVTLTTLLDVTISNVTDEMTPSEAAGQRHQQHDKEKDEEDQVAAEQQLVTVVAIPEAEPQELKRDVDADSRISGPTKTTIDKYPFVVSIHRWQVHHCTGTILSERWVLTAAHCLQGFYAWDLTVIAGETTVMKENDLLRIYKQAVPVMSMFWPPDYDGRRFFSDIGLIQTLAPIVMNDKVDKVHLASYYDTLYSDATVFAHKLLALGWGGTIAHVEARIGQPPPTVQHLTYAELPTTSMAVCTTFMDDKPLLSGQLCTVYWTANGDCIGDSGSPLMWKRLNGSYLQVALVSHTYGCSEPETPTVNTRVDMHYAWINAVMNQQGSMRRGDSSGATRSYLTMKHLALLPLFLCSMRL